MRASRRIPGVIFAALLLPGCAAAVSPAQEPSARYRNQFDNESDPVRKAKLFPRYGDEAFDNARALVGAGNTAAALKSLQEYRDNARALVAALKAKIPNPERNPSGFKQVQMHLRRAEKLLDDVAHEVPADERDAFTALAPDFQALDKEILDLLFPRRFGKAPPKKG